MREIDDETGEWTMRYEGEWSVVEGGALGEILVDWPASSELEFGEECWVVTLSAEGREAYDENRHESEAEVVTEAVHIAIGKETGYWRGLYVKAANPDGGWTRDHRTPVIATDIETEDATFVWKPPANAKTITWTPDNGREAVGKFQATRDPRTAKYRAIEREVGAAVEAGEMTREEAEQRMIRARRELFGGGRNGR